MSHPADATGPDRQPPVGTSRELRRRGRILGLEYDFGLRVSEISDLTPGVPDRPLLPRAPRPVLPDAQEGAAPPE